MTDPYVDGESLVFRRDKNGYEIRIAGYANYGWRRNDDSWLYWNVPMNYIGNYNESYVMPVITQLLAIWDCEAHSGPKSKHKYMTDRLSGYLAGYNGATFSLRGNNNLVGILGLGDFIFANVLKSSRQDKKEEDIYDDYGAYEGFFFGFILSALGNLIAGRKMVFSPARLLFPLLAGVIPYVQYRLKKDRYNKIPGTFTFDAMGAAPSIVVSEFEPDRAAEQTRINEELTDIGYEKLLEIMYKFVKNKNPPEFKKLMNATTNKFMVSVASLLGDALSVLHGEGRITLDEAKIAAFAIVAAVEPAHIEYDDGGRNYRREVRILNRMFARVSLKNWGDFFQYITTPLISKMVGNTNKDWWEPWPTMKVPRGITQLFFYFQDGTAMFPKEFVEPIQERIDILHKIDLLGTSTAAMLKGHFGPRSHFVEKYYDEYEDDGLPLD